MVWQERGCLLGWCVQLVACALLRPFKAAKLCMNRLSWSLPIEFKGAVHTVDICLQLRHKSFYSSPKPPGKRHKGALEGNYSFTLAQTLEPYVFKSMSVAGVE